MDNEIKASEQKFLFEAEKKHEVVYSTIQSPVLIDNPTKKQDKVLYNPNLNVKQVRKRYMMPRIVAFIPAHNEEKSIRDCLAGLADQTLPKYVQLDIFVIADNCSDRTEEKAFEAARDFGLNVIVLATKIINNEK